MVAVQTVVDLVATDHEGCDDLFVAVNVAEDFRLGDHVAVDLLLVLQAIPVAVPAHVLTSVAHVVEIEAQVSAEPTDLFVGVHVVIVHRNIQHLLNHNLHSYHSQV